MNAETKTENVLFRIFQKLRKFQKCNDIFTKKCLNFIKKHGIIQRSRMIYIGEAKHNDALRQAKPATNFLSLVEIGERAGHHGELKFCLSSKRTQNSDDLTNVTSEQKWTHES